MIKLIAIATATLAISIGAAMAKTHGYVNPDPLPGWMLATNPAGSSSTPTRCRCALLSTAIISSPAAIT